MLDIKKIGENFYLVNSEYTASSFNEAVIIANTGRKIKRIWSGMYRGIILEKLKK